MELNVTEDAVRTWYDKVQFSWYDYVLFCGMLVVSTLIGVYFGFFDKKKPSANEYLMGGKKMNIFPIAVSLVARYFYLNHIYYIISYNSIDFSHVSGVSILAVPADVYRFGFGYGLSFMSMFINTLLTIYVFLPVFYKLQITSMFEYLKLRFDTRVRLMASFLYALSAIFYLPIIIYVPALAFSQATNVSIHLITPIVCGVCIFYTTIGGLKAVVWTDTLQFTVTVGAMIAVFFYGVKAAGGPTAVYQISLNGGRLDVDFDFDPSKRDTFWSMLIGFSVYYITHFSINQGSVQKLLSLPTFRDSKKAVLAFGVGITIVKMTCVFTGLIIYAKYYNCDPITTGQVQKTDQILPYYVMDVAGHIPGLPGLFIAGVFCTALSTLSATLNSLSGSLYTDFVSRLMPEDITQQTVSNVLKLIVVIIGVVSTSLVFIVEHMGVLLPLSISLSSLTSGPLLGLFTFGMFFPKANSKGAFYGAVSSLCFLTWIIIGTQYYKAKGMITYSSLPVSTESCDFNFIPKNSTILDKPDEVFFMYRISYYYYSMIGAIVSLLVGSLVTYFTKNQEAPVRKELLSPIIYRFLKDEDQYFTVEMAKKVVELNDEK
ncbi:PREDICTED: sodium-coupled monocarboxylate transporter 2-like [Nicrophorus vespilloides]|uniref:Sodium-coupled monocarboxylate transporter 2-like n=1 Tax=Nicrophorus vespilloides TaxID=110193 RepID=A0ABM1M3E0_NICVS|nr:PREDICTED: sodium-coupled monocarboxylate transporter 2-like [Nicrophorus vespilloides]